MPNTLQARKRVRQNIKRRTRNMGQRSALRTTIKKFLKLVGEKNQPEASTAYREATIHIDRAVSKNLHHKNRAARLKKRLNSRLKVLSA